MSVTQKLIRHTEKILSWLAKIAGVGMVVLVGAFAIGEGVPNPFALPARQLVMLVFFFIALVGLALALWKQGVGGIVTVLGMIGFHIANGKFASGWVFTAIGVIGLVNIICGWLKNERKPPT